MRRNPNTWNDKMVHAELLKICAGTGVFPSNWDLQDLGRGDLANQITKRGGYIHWSKKLGFDRVFSDSDFGWAGEISCFSQLEKHGFKVERPSGVRSPYDLLVNECLRIDVKTANYAEYGVCRGWFYRMGKHSQSDVVMLYQSDTKDSYILPWYVCPSTNITISRDGGIYRNFKNKIDVIHQMAMCRKSEQEKYLSSRLKRGN